MAVANRAFRCIYRNAAQQFELDAKGLEFSRHLLVKSLREDMSNAFCLQDSGMINALDLVEKTFAYLPFEHSEDIENQKVDTKKYERF